MTHSPEASKFDQPGDLDPRGHAPVNIILYGILTFPAFREKEGVLRVNPGHLKTYDRRGYPLSYALMHLTPPRWMSGYSRYPQVRHYTGTRIHPAWLSTEGQGGA